MLTAEGILASLGYADPMLAAREHARMILLGRLARYEATFHQLESAAGKRFAELQESYFAQDHENAAEDDSYLDLKWHADAILLITQQLSRLQET